MLALEMMPMIVQQGALQVMAHTLALSSWKAHSAYACLYVAQIVSSLT